MNVLDVAFHDEQVGLVRSIDLETGFVVPLDDTVELFSVLEHDHYRSLAVHLLDVLEALCIGLLWWDGFSTRRFGLVFEVGQLGSDELAIHDDATSILRDTVPG